MVVLVFWRKWFANKHQETRTFSVPAGERVYAVGDIHGRADLLMKLQQLIDEDLALCPDTVQATIVFLGDYIDRGFHSREVLEHLLTLEMSGARLVFLAGNHEDMCLRFFEDPAEGRLWLGVGGMAALASYGVYLSDDNDLEGLLEASSALAARMPAAHVAFLKTLKEHYKIGDYLFVHAGLRPGVPLDAQRRSDKLGIRSEFTESGYDFGFKVVHGHSGVRKPKVFPNRIAVDTGAFATGMLTAAVLEGSGVRFIST